MSNNSVSLKKSVLYTTTALFGTLCVGLSKANAACPIVTFDTTISGASGLFTIDTDVAPNLQVTGTGAISNLSGNAIQTSNAAPFVVCVEAGGTVDASHFTVVSYSAPGTVSNAGAITSGVRDGVLLSAGGSAENLSGGSITGNNHGVRIKSAEGNVTNTGSITGTVLDGVNFDTGGTVTNQSGGTISGVTNAINIIGGVADVSNEGIINGDILFGTNDDSLSLLSGFTLNGTADGGAGVDNLIFIGNHSLDATSLASMSNFENLTLQDGTINLNNGAINFDKFEVINATLNINAGSITSDDDGVFVSGAAKTVTNAGSITGTAKDGVSFDTGGTVDNMVGSSILGDINGINILVAEGNVTNAGSITGTTNNGVDLDAGGTVDNLSGATITGGITGVKTTNVTASVANAGSIIGTTGGDGVDLGNGGSVDNIVGATITGDLKGVEVRNALGTVTNAGSITGTTEDGVNFTAGGTLNNLSGATITGATNGIIVTGGIANVTNAGTVNGGILFGANNDSLTIAAGSTTNGGADGGAGTDNVKFLGDQNVDETFSNFETATVQDGAVTWNDADANFDSLSLVNASLSYSGSAATVFIDVDSILSGTGTYGALSVNGGLAPGNSIGTMNVTGNYTMGSTANYEAEIFANGTSDLINVTGIATLDGILTVNFADAVASYDVTDAFTVLTAAGGISGDFNNFASVGASATRFPVYNLNGNDVVVTLVDATMIAPSALFSSGGDTANEKASSVLLPALTTSSVAASSLMTADAATINSTLEELSGSSHASMASIVASDAHEYINAVQSETKYVVDGYHTWMKFYGSSGTATSDGNARGYDYDGKGAAFGFGLGKADQFTVGIHGGYTWTDATFGTDVSAGRTKEAGVYAAGQLDDLHVSALYSYGWHDVETTRQITLGGIAKNDANTNSNKFKVEASYDVQLDQLTLAPVVSYNYASVDGIKLAETGAGVANLNGATDKFKSSQIRAGGRANYSVNFGEGGVLSPNAQVMYVSEQSDLNGTFLGSFEGAPNQDVAIRGLTFDKNRLEVDAGVHYKLASNISFNIGYRGIFMDTINTHGGRVGLNIVW